MNDIVPVKKIPVPTRLSMTPQVFAAICETIGTRHAESGGILGGSREAGEVTHFFFDDAPYQRTGMMYEPNTARLNKVRKNEWKPQGVAYLGSIHSHPPFCCRPSPGDEASAKSILEVLEIPYLLVPIVTTAVDTGSFTLYPFAAVLESGRMRIIEQELVVGGNLINPAQQHSHRQTQGNEEYVAALLGLSMKAMLSGTIPEVKLKTVCYRQGGITRREEIHYD